MLVYQRVIYLDIFDSSKVMFILTYGAMKYASPVCSRPVVDISANMLPQLQLLPYTPSG
jgi:hypothetical protein